MRTTVGRWGNSLGIRIPSGIATDVRLHEGAEVELTVSDGQLVVRPALSLATLVAAITPENLPALGDEMPRGGEVW